MMEIQRDMEAQYNNRARVPEHPALIAGWTSDAQSYRDERRSDAQLDQTYGGKPRQTYDFFPARPKTTKRSRTAVFIHGGYWQALDKSFFSHIAKGLNAHGYDVAIVNYSLCPDVSIHDIVSEMQLLAEEVYSRCQKPLLVFGHSAGGHLAAMLMATDWVARGLPKDLVDRVMPISGLFDLTPLLSTSINDALNMSAQDAQSASPLYGIKPTSGRFIAVVGGDESSEYLRQSRQLTEEWAAEELSGTLDIQAGANHFNIINPLAVQDSPLTSALALLGE
ncbi:alpha/beta hydrolase [Roseibium algae]|uniref:Alpha/beta hydrolase n=1 Tax=Roseibium algae TaxID=3123038 RepID=A0ABU8TIJ9_9HYPH